MKPEPLPVTVEKWKMKVAGVNILPTVVKMFNIMPEKMRHKMTSKQNAPKLDQLPKDLHDITGDDPYTKEEIVKDRVWVVTHFHQNSMIVDKGAAAGMKMLGIDPTDEKSKAKMLEGAASIGPEVVDLAKKDFETMINWDRRIKAGELTKEDHKNACSNKNRMFVVKLDSGSLLLYNVCRIREEHGLKSWLDSLGKVEWIVVGSSYHTNWMHGVLKQYPDAKVVGTTASQEKLKVINALQRGKYDYNVAVMEEYETVKKVLEKEGVSLFYVDGDMATNSLALVINRTLLTVDLLYGSYDGQRVFDKSKDEILKNGHGEAGLAGLRLFWFRTMCKPNSPNGCLANYRFWMMDPGSFGAMGYDQPARDGSSCKLMAGSLRKLLSLDFDHVWDVHNGQDMSRDTFQKDINASWNWLDGTSLL